MAVPPLPGRPTRAAIAAAMKSLDATAGSISYQTEAQAEYTTLKSLSALLEKCISSLCEDRPLEVDEILADVETATPSLEEVEALSMDAVKARVAVLRARMMALLNMAEPEVTAVRDANANTSTHSEVNHNSGAAINFNAESSTNPQPARIITDTNTNKDKSNNSLTNDDFQANTNVNEESHATLAPSNNVVATLSAKLALCPNAGPSNAISESTKAPLTPDPNAACTSTETSRQLRHHTGRRDGESITLSQTPSHTPSRRPTKSPPVSHSFDADATLVNDEGNDLVPDDDDNGNNNETEKPHHRYRPTHNHKTYRGAKRKYDPDSGSESDPSSESGGKECWSQEDDSGVSDSSSSSTSSSSGSSCTASSKSTSRSSTLSLFSPNARRSVWHTRKLNKEIWEEFRCQAAPLGGSLLAARRRGLTDDYAAMNTAKKSLNKWMDYAQQVEDATSEDIQDLANAILAASDCASSSKAGRQLWEDIRGSCRRAATGSRGGAARGLMARERRRAGVNAEDLYGCPDWRAKKDSNDERSRNNKEMRQTAAKKRKY